MDTFELLPSLAQGELGETSAPELVLAVFRSRASGTLWLETETGAEVRCYFRAGDMCGSAQFEGFQTLARVLLETELVDALAIDESRIEADATGKRHGEVLVAQGLLTPDQLRTALEMQHRANLSTLLALTSGKYDWRGWEPPPAWAQAVRVDPISCIVAALEGEGHAPRRRRVLEWLGGTAARLSLDWPELQSRVSLDPLDRRAAALLALPRTVDEFTRASRLDRPRAEALLVTLLLAGGAEPQPAASAGAPEVLEDSSDLLTPIESDESPLPAPEPDGHEELGLALSEPEHEEAPAERQRAPLEEHEAFARLDALMLDDPLPGPAAPHDAAAAAFAPADDDASAFAPAGFEQAPRPQPVSQTARFTGPGEIDFGPEEQDPQAEERARELRKKMLARGMRNLGSLPPPSASAQRLATPAEVQPVDESSLSPDEQRFIDEVRSRASSAAEQTYYARLGIEPTASTDRIKSAYLDLARRYHPDLAGRSAFAGVHRELLQLFTSIKEAYEELTAPNGRARYNEKLQTGAGKTLTRQEEAATLVKMGDVLLKKRDFEGGIARLRRAVDLDATGDAMAALAWALMGDPKATAAMRDEAATIIGKALRAPGCTARTYYVAGVLWRTKDPDSAVDAFRKALELDPRHADAALELRLIEQRRGKQQKGGGVLSGLLFGKRRS